MFYLQRSTNCRFIDINDILTFLFERIESICLCVISPIERDPQSSLPMIVYEKDIKVTGITYVIIMNIIWYLKKSSIRFQQNFIYKRKTFIAIKLTPQKSLNEAEKAAATLRCIWGCESALTRWIGVRDVDVFYQKFAFHDAINKDCAMSSHFFV